MMAWMIRYSILTCLVWCVQPLRPLTKGPQRQDGGGESVARAPRSNTGYAGSVVRVRRKAADSTQLWPDAVVPFTFLAPEPERAIVWKGLAHWQEHTCLRFFPVNDTQLPHLQFRRLSGCRSGVGIEGASGQNISIGDNCNKMGIVVHEIGHAVGFYHEIRRPDRDEHVVVNEKNILKEELFNFYKLHWLDVSIKYDLSSVMHYHTLEWSANGKTTVATRDPTLQGLIGMWKLESSQGLSHRDKLLANKMYGCLDEWLAKCNLNRNPCENEGYLSENCTCVCPPGTAGRTCQDITGGYYDHLKSPCSREVTYPTTISTPHYPSNYDADTWCVYRLQAPECHAPEVTVHDFQLGPRDFRDQCFHDYLEVRNESLYDGFLKCGTEVVRGTRWIASSSVMILFFKGAEGGYRGFKAQVRFIPIPGCCETHSNSSSSVYLHSPGYPSPFSGDFHCTYGLAPEAPARVVVTVARSSGSSSAADPWTCALRLCQPNGRCYRHCRKLRQRWLGSRGQEVVLPNVASLHHLQFSASKSPFRVEKAAFQVAFTLEDSPCHKTVIVNRSDPRGWITVGPRFFEILQCEWWFQAPRGSHVKVSVEDLYLPGLEDSYLAVNEAGEATFPSATTRVYYRQEDTPQFFVSLEHKLSLVLQGDFLSHMTMMYELYECVDEDQECEYWAVNDECEKNPLWMKPHCRRSCFRCDYSRTCENRHRDCEFWAEHDQCQENRFWMHVHCQQACGICELCWDANTWCPRWAALGDCEGNPDYMDQFCRKSCGLCEDGEPSMAKTDPPTKNITTTVTSKVTRPIPTSTPDVSDPSPKPRRNRTNKLRKCVTTTPTSNKTTPTTNIEENETTRGISINQTFKPQKGKGKYKSHKKKLKERGDMFNNMKLLNEKQITRPDTSSPQPSNNKKTTKLLNRERIPRVLQPSKYMKPYNKNGTNRQFSRQNKNQTAVTLTPQRTTKISLRKKVRGAGVVTAAPYRDNRVTASSLRRDNVSQSSRGRERVTPVPLAADNMTLSRNTVTQTSPKAGRVSQAPVRAERLIQTSKTKKTVVPTADRVTLAFVVDSRMTPELQGIPVQNVTSSLSQNLYNASSMSSERRSNKSSSPAEKEGSTTLEDPRVVYKSQGIHKEGDPSSAQLDHVGEVCEGGDDTSCSDFSRDAEAPTSNNEAFLNSLIRSHRYESITRGADSTTVAPGQSRDTHDVVKKRKQRRHGRNKKKLRKQRRRNKNKTRKHRRRHRKRTGRWGQRRSDSRYPHEGGPREDKRTGNRKVSRRGGGGKKHWRGDATEKENQRRSGGKAGRDGDLTPDATKRQLPQGLNERRRQDRSHNLNNAISSIFHPLLTTQAIPTHSPPITQALTTPRSTHLLLITQTPTLHPTHSPLIIQAPITQSSIAKSFTTQPPTTTHLPPTTHPLSLSITTASPLFLPETYTTPSVLQHPTGPSSPERLTPAIVRATISSTPLTTATPTTVTSTSAKPTTASLLSVEPPAVTLTTHCSHCPWTSKTELVTEELYPAEEEPSAEQRQVAQPPQNLHRNYVYGRPPPSSNSAIPPHKQKKPRKHKLPIRRRRLPKDQQLYWRLHEMHRRFTKQKLLTSSEELHKRRYDKHRSRYQFDRNDSAQWNSIIRDLSTGRHRLYPYRSLGRHHPHHSAGHSITRHRNKFPRYLGYYRRVPHSQRLAERTETTSRSEMHTADQTQTETQKDEENMDPTREEGPPPRSPEKYAEWGIGPVKHTHHPSRRTRPGWKFRRAFYRRKLIYEDIRPPRPLRDRGFSRTYT